MNVSHCRAKQQNLEERQADVEYELRCLLNKPGVFGLIMLRDLVVIAYRQYVCFIFDLLCFNYCHPHFTCMSTHRLY